MVEVSFSSEEPGFHSWQFPGCCLYRIVFLLKSADLGWEEAVSPGVVSVTEPRPREFISSKLLPPLISRGNLKTFLAKCQGNEASFSAENLNLDTICKWNHAIRKRRIDEVVRWAVDRPWGKGLHPNLWEVSGQLMLLLTQIMLTDRVMDVTLELESSWCAALCAGH